MKNIKMKFTLLVTSLTVMTACKKDFITIQPQGQFLSENYYGTRDQAYTGVVGVYDVLRKNAGGFENMITFMNAASDDNFAGGGNSSDGAGIHGFQDFTINANTMPGSYWNDHYQGIFRANILLSKLPGVTMNAAEKARFTAETKALRAIYYFNLVRLFKNIPLILEPVSAAAIYDVVQAAPTAVYTQIEKDLTDAIADLPATVSGGDAGRLTKGGIQAMLGKVLLFDGKASQAATTLALVNGTPGQTNQYGNKLLSNFADLWVFTNKFNTEALIEGLHTNQSNADWGFWGGSNDEGNSVNQMVGPRSWGPTGTYTGPDIYRSGWSFNTFTQDFYDANKPDPRFAATVFDAKAYVTAGQATYIAGDNNTGYFINKFLPRRSDQRTGGGTLELNFQQNDYIIRLADTYLLEAEALGASGARAQALLDAVRARVGLTPVPVSLAAIKAERRLELAGEGHRFFDLVRWGDAAAKLAGKGFKAGKNEILPIPARELTATKLVQNPNYQ
jgi:hypothetical protein